MCRSRVGISERAIVFSTLCRDLNEEKEGAQAPFFVFINPLNTIANTELIAKLDSRDFLPDLI